MVKNTLPVTWRALTKADLKAFDVLAQGIILDAMARGGVGRISAKGHAIIRAPGGGTMAVSRNTNTGNRTAANTKADYNRLFGNLPLLDEPAARGAAGEADTGTSVDASVAEGTPAGSDLPVTDDLHPTIECPMEGCEAVFVTGGARYSHIHKVHAPCPEPGCEYIGKNKNAMLAHKRIRHGTNKPWEVAAQNRKARSVNDTKTLNAIRELLGDDPRVKELETELKAEKKKVSELEAKIAKLKAVFE